MRWALKRRGMTLLEVVIVAGIMSALMLAYAQMNSQTMKGAATTKLENDFSNLQMLLSSVLVNTVACNANLTTAGNFASTNFNSSVANASIQVNKITLPNGNVLVKNGQQISSGLTVSALQLNAFQQISPGNYMANLNLQAAKTAGKFVGSQTLIANIPLTFQTTSLAPPTVVLTSCGASSTSAPTCVGTACFRQGGDGTIEQWGSTLCPSTICVINFPHNFTTLTNLIVNDTVVVPGMGNVTSVIDSFNTTGFTVRNYGEVNVGGSGGSYTGGGTNNWRAIGN